MQTFYRNMKRTTRNGARTKQEIIEKSAPVFNVHGFAGTTMKMLVANTGYEMGGIYRHFKTKKELAQAVFEYNYETLIKRNLEFDPSLNAKEKLLAIIQSYREMVTRPIIPGGCPLLNTAIEVDDTQDDFRRMAKKFVEEVLEMMEHILEEGRSQGLFRADLDPKKEALYLFACVEGSIMIGKLTRTAQPFLSILDQMSEYLEDKVFIK